MKDPSLVRGIFIGCTGMLLLLLLVGLFGHLPYPKEPKHNCLCPDSGTIVSPRSLAPTERN
jgi:hypothetical protein